MNPKPQLFTIAGVCIACLQPAALRAVPTAGFPAGTSGAYVASGVAVPHGTVVRGIEFWSNDAIEFPLIALVKDSPSARPPTASPVRIAEHVMTPPGYTVVTFDRYVAEGNQFLWIVIRFPTEQSDNREAACRPGIGWTLEHPAMMRSSIFGDNDCVNEFLGSFAIMLLVDQEFEVELNAKGTESSRALVGEQHQTVALSLQQRWNSVERRATVQMTLHESTNVALGVYDVRGRRMCSLEDGYLDAGQHLRSWDGTTDSGTRVASGVYFASAMAHGQRATTGIVILR